MPNEDFLAYIALHKNSNKDSIPSHDRYTFYSETIPKNIHKINSNLKKAFKKEEKKGDPEEEVHLLKVKTDEI